ncbi:hypothetical protein RhiirB3_436696 [Rhizophagus irregularis]|nr:hypothetical protein RhiirB3_436696 [Rhizophagus irregularis]
MSCSKIFSGDLPELTYEIIKYLQNDVSTLHSCILINRLWCRLAIPLLWENPFSIRTGNYNFIEMYLHNLNDNDFKTKPLNTLFNYLNYIKYLNTWKFMICIEIWSKDAIRTLKPENKYFIQNINIYSKVEFMKLISISLFKIFIENEVNLYTLDIDIIDHRYNEYFNDIFELIIQNNTNFIQNIKNLSFYTNIYNTYCFEDTLLKNRISQIINLHKNLKRILLSHDYLPLYKSLLLSKDSNCSNTLNTIILYRINFGSIINLLNKVFEQLNVIESIHIIYCYFLNSNFIQQIINLSKPFKLKSLFMNEKLRIELLQLLMQQSGDYLENFGYEFDYDNQSNQQLLELITNCKNIKFLDLCKLRMKIIYQIFNLIENVKQNLNYLSISIDDYQDSNNICSSTILQNLGQILPSKLEYLNLVLKIKANDFEVFLKNSKDIFIKELLIMQKGSDDILHYIKKFIMEEKRVEYLAIWNFKYGDLPYFESEVKEFELYNIKLNYYYTTLIHPYNFMKELD